MSDFSTIPQLTLKVLSTGDTLPIYLEKTQYNFDQILLHGGGQKGDKGDDGDKGVPGATGIGIKGDQGKRGSYIFFQASSVTNGQLVTNPEHLEEDVIIDNDGDYFQVEENVGTGDLEYIFKFNINLASLNTYWIDQQTFIDVGGNPIDEWLRLDEANQEHNLLLLKRFDKGGNDRADFYRVVLGMEIYPFGTPEVTASICNVLPNNVDNANDNPFYQFAFKYRDDAFSNPSANSTFFKYTEQVSGFNRYLFSVLNSSVEMHMRHDTNDTDDSEFIIRGHHFKLIGKSVDIDTVTEWVDIMVDNDLTTVTTQKDLTLTPDGVLSADMIVGYDKVIFNPADGGAIQLETPLGTDMTFVVGGAGDVFDFQAESVSWTNDLMNFYAFGSAMTWVVNDNLTWDLQDDVEVVSSGLSEWKFSQPLTVAGRLNMESTLVEINASNQLDLSGVETPIVLVQPNQTTGEWQIQSIINGAANRAIWLVADADDRVRVEHNGTAIYLGSQGHIQLMKSQSILLWTPDGSLYQEISGSFGDQRATRRFIAADWGTNYDNIVHAGLYRQTSNTVMANANPDVDNVVVFHASVMTETYDMDAGTTGILQIQYNLYDIFAGPVI